jgi:hypothetical protein
METTTILRGDSREALGSPFTDAVIDEAASA